MVLEWTEKALLFSLYISTFIVIDQVFRILFDRQRLKNRLQQPHHHPRKSSLTSLGILEKQWLKVETHLDQMLGALRFTIKGERLLLLLVSMAIGGLLLGSYLFHSTKGAVLCSLLFVGSPYIALRMILIYRRVEAQIDFLPAVELFYQCYLITGERQIKIALARAIEEQRLVGSMGMIFEQLHRNLSVHGDDEESLTIFKHALGHIWADYFAQMLQVAIQEGVSISVSLRELIKDMRGARRANEQERHRLLEIRIANFTPIVFLALFLSINVYVNKEQALYYYVSDAGGREMILNALTMVFLSFLMGIYLSRRKLD